MRAWMLALAGLLVGAEVRGFEVDGFRSGMTFEDASRVAESKGLVVSGAQGRGFRSSQQRDAGTGALTSGPGFRFCRNRLVSYQVNIAGGVSDAVRLGEQLTREHGPGTAEFVNVVMARGSLLGINTTWTDGSDKIAISVLFQGERVWTTGQSWTTGDTACK